MRLANAEGAGLHRIVIVGGGAGGVELATALGEQCGRQQQAHITLIDRNPVHIWKPILHEIAAGSLDYTHDALEYAALAHAHHFRFHLGSFIGLDREQRQIQVDAYLDEDGNEIIPARRFAYDTLVIAIGSLSNDFNIPGAAACTYQLDTAEQAERFHQKLVNMFRRANDQTSALRPEQLKIAIVGGGATGVELAAELHGSIRALVSYGLDNIKAEQDVMLSVIEAAPRILPELPERISAQALRILQKFKVNICTHSRVTTVHANGVQLESGDFIPAELVVWAAGIRAPAILHELAGLETNKLNQLVVKPTLQTTRDDTIFAFGDCASAPWLGQKTGITVPARAQAAHQQAKFLSAQLQRRLQHQPLQVFRYQDFGSLVSLGENWAIGGLMGKIARGTFFMEGHLARMVYDWLYKEHQWDLQGLWKVTANTLSDFLRRRTSPRVKLH